MKFPLLNFLFLILFGLSNLQAQISLRKKTTTRAVIVGISDYQRPEIPDLQFADRDAQAFAEFLKSTGGGNLAEENVRLLTNKDATTANLAAELDWLMTESKENDLAIIYFSGHGDVETKTRSQMGFLLTYDSPNVTYIAGAFPVYYLQEVVSTLSIDKKCKVVLITDACHAGKLAGNSVNGSQATASNLARQFASEIKILSCQPNEYSNESTRWGGGRGVFSWYLVNGLYGLADGNNDLTVNLLELSHYLEDKIPAAIAPESQIPMVFGNRMEVLSVVDEQKLHEAKKNMEQKTDPLGFAKTPKSPTEHDTLPEELRQLEQVFLFAIQEGRLLPPSPKNAYDYWQLLIRKAHDHSLTRQCGFTLSANLQSIAQQTFNTLILFQSGKETEMSANLRFSTNVAMEYLDRTNLILGNQHFSAKNIRAKRTYLEAMLVLEDLKSNNSENSKVDAMIQKAESALKNAPDATYLYYVLGELYAKGKNNPRKSLEYFEDAKDLSPNWDALYVGITYATERLNKSNNPNDLGEEKVGTNSQTQTNDFIEQTQLADKLLANGEVDAATKIYEYLMDLYPKNAVAISNYGFLMTQKGRYNEAEEILLDALKMKKEDPRIYCNLSNFYINVGSIEQAESYHKKGKTLYPNDLNIGYESARILALKEKNEEATQQLMELVRLGYPNIQRVKTDIAFKELMKKAIFKEKMGF
jgi:protein O-mannosyl-transferase